VAVRAADSIETYLDDPIVPSALIAGQGGIMKYWYHLEEPNPKLSRMGSDFLSAPGKHSIKMFHYGQYSSVWLTAASTDAERAFSKGRREVNFMQHNMSSQTFKAEMAVGSWDGTPLMPNISEAIRVIERKMARGATSDDDLDSHGEMDTNL
jgi:hypothetical protein